MSNEVARLSQDQQRLIETLIAVEIPLTGNELVEKHGFRDSYISSGLRGLALKGLAQRVGKTAPINGRSGQQLWTATKEAVEMFPKEISPIDIGDLLSSVGETNAASIIEQNLHLLDQIISTTALAKKLNLDLGETRAALSDLCRAKSVYRLATGRTNEKWISQKAFVQLQVEEINASSKTTGRGFTFAAQVTALLKQNGPMRTSAIAKVTGKSVSNVHIGLMNAAAKGKITRTKTIGAFGKKVYWSTNDNVPHKIQSA